MRALVMSFIISSRSIILLEWRSSNSRLSSCNLFSYAFFFRVNRLNSASVSNRSPLAWRSSCELTSSRLDENTSWCSSRRDTISSCVDGMCPVTSSRLWRRVSPLTKRDGNCSKANVMTALQAAGILCRVIILSLELRVFRALPKLGTIFDSESITLGLSCGYIMFL